MFVKKKVKRQEHILIKQTQTGQLSSKGTTAQPQSANINGDTLEMRSLAKNVNEFQLSHKEV